MSKKTIAKEAVKKLNKMTNPLNCFLAACYEIFSKVNSLEYNKTKATISYLSVFNRQFINPKVTKKRHKILKIFLFTKFRLNILYKAAVYKTYRVWLFKRVSDKNWHKEKLIQLGFKK